MRTIREMNALAAALEAARLVRESAAAAGLAGEGLAPYLGHESACVEELLAALEGWPCGWFMSEAGRCYWADRFGRLRVDIPFVGRVAI